MKAKIIISIFMLVLAIGVYSQKSNVELTFTAINNTEHVQLDSIKIINRSQGCDTVLYYPDSVLSIYFVDIQEYDESLPDFKVFQNFPNPVTNQTTITLFIPETDIVTLIITDILGRILVNDEGIYKQGFHSFRFEPGNCNIYFFTAIYQERSSTIKILQTEMLSYRSPSLEYVNYRSSSLPPKKAKEIQSFSFGIGDELIYVGFIETLHSGISDSPEASKTYTFQFATNVPCIGTPTLEYEGQLYNTIQIFSQCWLKENLNVGTMILGTEDMYDNGIIEKYCYNDELDSCSIYGGLYQWNEMMQFTTSPGARGICPEGWHIPTSQDWMILEGCIDSLYGIGDIEWDSLNIRGYDAGKKLKSENFWIENGNGINSFGFNALPAGYRDFHEFASIGKRSSFWTSNFYYSFYGFYRNLWYADDGVLNMFNDVARGFNVRCLKD